MKRTIHDADHQDLRESYAAFLTREVAPVYDTWEEETGVIDRAVLKRAGDAGFLGLQVGEEHGGADTEDFRFNQVLAEEGFSRGLAGFAMAVQIQNDVVLPYLTELTTQDQKDRWLPGVVSGDLITAIGMSEPGTGSDLAHLSTRAVRDGDHYVVNGAKTFITNGINADLVVCAVRTGDTGTHRDISILAIEADTPGFSRGRNLDKLGLHSQDTAELFFQDMRVPVENLIGEEGLGFKYMMQRLPQERLTIAIAAAAAAKGALDGTLEYVKQRTAFGRPVGTFQNSRFELASCFGELQVTQAHIDTATLAHNDHDLSAEDAAIAKWWATEAQGRIVDRCLQLHGGYGYMLEYPIARFYADARINRIYGGPNEVMLEIVGRSMGLADPR
ncbi:acyl-CoA dehydrogenase family protein [Patulibacter minatonensis]|uniref:acyl-CoA dehydrogenase family protein n=1 Tax=Patulibacter minatonensis TaxID=298163 RepID=UPI00047DF919|nr:acyl-CoA dehydrogenase family protein [Patulibacter minatonensis]